MLLAQGLVDEAALAGVLEPALRNLPEVDFSRVGVEKEALALVPESYARENTILPIRLRNDELEVATVDPGDLALLAELKVLTRKRIKPVIAVSSEINKAILQFYKLEGGVSRHVRSFEETFQPTGSGRRLAEVKQDAPVVQIVDLIVAQGVEECASDIHIEPQADHLRVRFRIDGVLHDATRLPVTLAAPIASRLKLLANLDIVDKRHSQDGQIQTTVEGRPLDIRVGTIETIWGEKVVLRLLERSRSILRLDPLGFSPATRATFMDLIRSPYGMILVTGPTGSGKTTTLYAALNELDSVEQNVMTIEDPVEYTFNITRSRSIGSPASPSPMGCAQSCDRIPMPSWWARFATRRPRRSRCNQPSPDTSFFTSLHATDAVGAIYRFLEMGIEPFMVASSVIGVEAQRLVRRIANSARFPIGPPSNNSSSTSRSAARGRRSSAGPAAPTARTPASTGRIGIFEVLKVTDSVKQLIVRNAPPEALRKQVIENGMTTLRESGLAKIDEGLTTIGEVMRSVHVGEVVNA